MQNDWSRTEVRMLDRDLERVLDVCDDDQIGDKQCCICVETFDTVLPVVTIRQCTHNFHLECIATWLAEKSTCPVCRLTLFTLTGFQPKHQNSKFEVTEDFAPLSGYPECTTLVLWYHIESGRQNSDMPLPGDVYHGLDLTTFLPNNGEGREVVRLLTIAWNRGLLFRIGLNPRTSRMDQIVPNGFEFKLRKEGGLLLHGFPDPSYMNRLKSDLKDVGVV